MTSLAFAILGSAMLPKLQLIVFLLLVSLLLVGYISIRISSMFYLPTVFCMGIMPMLLLGLTWTESRLPWLASPGGLDTRCMSWRCCSLAYFRCFSSWS
jgi:hypothetical protein